jgi:hypothetical protein
VVQGRTNVAQPYAPHNISDQQVITVKEARKLLGQKAKNLTKEELEALIQATETVVRVSIRTYISSKNVENNVNIPSTGTTL